VPPGFLVLPARGSGLASGQQVPAARLDLARIAHALQAHLGAEARTSHGLGDNRWLEETEVDVHLLVPPSVQVPDLRADMKGDEEKPVRPQHAVDLTEGLAKLARLKVDDRVEGDSRPELTVCRRKLQQVPLTELHPGVLPAANGDHARGQVNTDCRHAAPGEPGCDMPRATPQIGNGRAIFGLLGQAGQQRPVERLARELIAEPGRVLLGHSVVASANGVTLGNRLLHDESLHHRPGDQAPTEYRGGGAGLEFPRGASRRLIPELSHAQSHGVRR
jgi:hypothetical protein